MELFFPVFLRFFEFSGGVFFHSALKEKEKKAGAPGFSAPQNETGAIAKFISGSFFHS